MIACAEGWLDGISISLSSKFSATVVVAAGGYPGSYEKGTEMKLDSTEKGK
jgi:phosphoribosylamine--glycine ligase/phosphoribosylformylglycinamidine cyclo-ligase